MFAQLANEIYARGSTIHDYYAELCEKYGHFVSCNHYYRATDKVSKVRVLAVVDGASRAVRPCAETARFYFRRDSRRRCVVRSRYRRGTCEIRSRLGHWI